MAAKLRLRRPTGDNGAQAVEFALVWTFVLSPLLYGLIAFGFVMADQITASQLAREVARYAAICAGQPSAVAATCNSDAKSQFATDEMGSWTSRSGSASVDTTDCVSGSATVLTATVQVTPVLPVPFVSTVQGKASTPCGG